MRFIVSIDNRRLIKRKGEIPMKKTISVILALIMMMGLLAMPVGAKDDVATREYVDAPAQVFNGEEIVVELYVNGNVAAGGVQGTIAYDADAFDYVGADLRSDVVALGNVEDVTVKADEDAGTVNFVCLSNVDGGKAPADAWVTLKFTVKATSGQYLFSLSNVKAADKSGTTKLDVTQINKWTEVIAGSDAQMKGATIRTDIANQGIRFEGAPDLSKLDPAIIKEVGIVIMPKALMYENQDLTIDLIGKGGAEPAIAKITATDNAALLDLIKNGEALYATLTNGITGGRANMEIVARTFIVDESGSVRYSHNDIADKNVTDGEAVKSLVSVAQAIAAKEIAGGATNTLGDLLTKTDVLENDEVTTLLTFCRDNYDYLGA